MESNPSMASAAGLAMRAPVMSPTITAWGASAQRIPNRLLTSDSSSAGAAAEELLKDVVDEFTCYG